jgi:hypothetical protein
MIMPLLKAHILINTALHKKKIGNSKMLYFRYKYLRETVKKEIVEKFPRKI